MPSSSAPQMPFASQQNMFAQAAPPRVPSQPHMSGPLGTYAGATSQPMSAPGPLPQMPVSAAQPSPQPQSFAGGMPPPQPTGRPTRPPSSMGRAGMAPPRSGMMNAGPMPPQMMHQLQQIQQLQAQINHFNNTLNHPSHQSFPQSYRQTVQQQRDAFQHQLAQAAATFKEMQKHFAPQMQQTQRMPPSAPGQQAMPPAGMRPPSRVGGTPAPQPNGVPYRGPTPSAMPQHMMQHQQQPAIGSSPQMSPNAAAAPFFPPQMQPPQMQSQMQPQIQSQMQPQMQSQLPMRSGSMSMSTGPPTMNAASPAQYASTPQNAPTPYSGAPTPQQQMSASASSPAVAMQQLPRSSFSHPGHPTQSIPPQQPMDSMQIYQRMVSGLLLSVHSKLILHLATRHQSESCNGLPATSAAAADHSA